MIFEKFGNIVVSKEPVETHIIKFSQPKQTDVLNVTTSDGQQHNGAIAYKVSGIVPEYLKFPINTENCTNTYSTTTQQQYITPYLYSGKLSFTSDKINSNVYLGVDSEQSWSIILSNNSTTNCTVYIASNTNDIGLNPPYYLEVESPKNKTWTKKISITNVNNLKDVKNNTNNYKGRLTPSVKVTTIKNDINALWLLEKVNGIEFLRLDFDNILTGAFEFLELMLKVARDERKQFIQTMINGLKPVADTSSSLDSFIAQLESIVPTDAALTTFGINGTYNNQTGREIIIETLSKGLKELDKLYRIKSVPFNLYLTANKSGGGIYRGSITLSSIEAMNSANVYWKINPTNGSTNTPLVEGFDVANFIKNISAKKDSYKPVLVADSYPTIKNYDGKEAAGWDAEYNKAWNGNYIYRGTSLSNPKQLLKVDLNSENGIQGGRGTITVDNKIYNVKHVTKDEMIGYANNGDTIRAKLIDGTSVNKGRPVMVFLVNGKNICDNNFQNQKQYCSKIDGDEVSNYQDQYQAAGIKMLDMKNGLGIPQVNLNVTDPNPCNNQNNNSITKDCAEHMYYGKEYPPGSDIWKENSCTNQSFFENVLWPNLQNKDLAYSKNKITQIQKNSIGTNPNLDYLRKCKGDTLSKLDGKFVKNKDGSEVYYIYNAMAYQIPSPSACFPGDHTSSEVVTLTDSQINEIKQFKSNNVATPSSGNPNVAAACIVKAANGKTIAASDKEKGIIFVIYNGKKYWLSSYGGCGSISNENNVIRSYNGYNFSSNAIDIIPSISNTGVEMSGNFSAITNFKNMAQANINSSDPNIATFCKNMSYNANLNSVQDKKPVVMYGNNMFFRFPKLVDAKNPSGRYLSGDRTGGNIAVLANPNSVYESRTDKGYIWIASKQLYGPTGSGPIKYGDVFALKCDSLERFLSGSRGGNRGINTENPKSTYEANVITESQKAMKENPQGKNGYSWSFVPGDGNTAKNGYPVLYGDQVMLKMSLWNGDVLTAFKNTQVHNFPPNFSLTGSTNQIIIDNVWKYPSELK